MTEPELIVLLGRLRAAVAADRARIAGVVAALAADGRAFSATPEGQRWRELLERSDFLPRARLLWDALGLGGTGGARAPSPLPSEAIRDLAAAVRSPRLEAMLASLPILGSS